MLQIRDKEEVTSDRPQSSQNQVNKDHLNLQSCLEHPDLKGKNVKLTFDSKDGGDNITRTKF